MFIYRVSMQLPPSSLTGRTVLVLGVLALSMGLLGLVNPAAQFALMGFQLVTERGPGDYTPALLTITSLASVNVAILYLVGAVKAWPGFVLCAIITRLGMAAALTTLVLTGRGPNAFAGAAAWEGLGAAVLVLTSGWERKKRQTTLGDRA